MGPCEVGGVGDGAERVARGVGDRDRLVLVGERDHRQHRPEDLVLGEPARRIDVGEHRRRDEVAGGERPLESSAARDQPPGPSTPRVVDHAEDAVGTRLGDDRTHEAWRIERVAHRRDSTMATSRSTTSS